MPNEYGKTYLNIKERWTHYEDGKPCPTINGNINAQRVWKNMSNNKRKDERTTSMEKHI